MEFPQEPILKIVLLADFTDASTDVGYRALLLAKSYETELKALYAFNP